MKKLPLHLTLSLLLSFVLGLFHPAALIAEDGAESEDLSFYNIEGETDDTYLRDHLERLLEIVDEQGYELGNDPTSHYETVRLGWTGILDVEAGEFMTVLVADSFHDSSVPIIDRPLMINYLANLMDSEEAIATLLDDMGKTIPFDISDAELPETDFEDIFHGSVPLAGTDTKQQYLFMKSVSQSDGPSFVYLSSMIQPLVYQGANGVEAIGDLADYLYSQQDSDEAPFEIFAEASIQSSLDGVRSHIISYRTKHSLADNTTVSHSIHFEPETSDDDIEVYLTYLEDHLPDDIAGIAELITEVPEVGDSTRLAEEDWAVNVSRDEDSTSFWLNYVADTKEN